MSALVAQRHPPSWVRSTVITASPTSAEAVLRGRFDEIAAFRTRPRPPADLGLDGVLSHLPVTGKDFYLEAGEGGFLEPARSVLLFSETSGTSGSPPLLTPRGRNDLTWNTFNQALAYRDSVKAGRDRVMLLNPSVMSPFIEASSRALFDLGVAHLRAYPIPKVCDWRRLGRLIAGYKITAIMSTPSLVLKLLYELRRASIAVPSLTTLMLTGEHLSRPLLAGVDRALGVEDASRPLVYGSSEAASVMRGRPDGDYTGYLDDFLFEIAPTDESWTADLAASLPPNAAVGRLLISWLRDGIMPIVRYDTQDVFSCWQEAGTGEVVFRSHGRAAPGGLSPLAIESLETLLFTGPGFAGDPVVHYDVSLADASARLALVTLGREPSEAPPALVEAVSHSLGRPASVLINPAGHSFYDFSPRPKSTRIEYLP